MIDLNARARTPLFGAALSLALLAGCTGETLVDDTITPPGSQACGGAGILCNVSGIAGEYGGGAGEVSALESRHYWPMDLTVAPNDELLIVDWNNHCVWTLDEAGVIHRVIGSGNLGDTPEGQADQLNLNHPTGITIGPDGMYYLSAWHNWKVKRIDPATWVTDSPVGTTQGFLGDGGPADQAKMDLPSSAVFDLDGNMYVSDQGNARIRKVSVDGTITTLVGGGRGYADGVGEDALFDAPFGPDASPGLKIAIDPDGTTLYVADTRNNRIRKIDIATRTVTTIAGTGAAGYAGDGGAATSAQLNWPTDVYLTHDNELFIADSQNHVIRKIDANGVISTVVGTGVAGTSPNGTPAAEAQLNRPMGVAYDEAHHTLYIADTFNHQTKRVELSH